MNKKFKFVDTDEDDIIMTGKQIDFMESEGLDTTGMRRFNNESISRGVANTHVFQETLKTTRDHQTHSRTSVWFEIEGGTVGEMRI